MAKPKDKVEAPAAKAATIKVRVVEPAGIDECLVHYKKGETLEVTEERAAALGDVVEVISEPAAK
jgi:hypothetical protein